MTVDNSQIAGRDVIILQASTVPPAVLITSPPYGSERGRESKHDDVAVLNKVSQHEQLQQKQALDQQHEKQQQQQQRPSLVKNSEPRDLAISPSTETNHISNTDANADVPPQPVAAAPTAVARPSVQNMDQQKQQQQQQQAATPSPKWVRVGEKVCFSTVVAAVLIPSSRDLTADDKRELWWQAADYSDFRVNYATHMLNPSIELEEQEGTGPAPTVPVSSNADSPASTATATVEGVLVVAASPAPAPLTSRQVNVNQSTARHGGGGGDAAPSQDRVSKSSRHEKNARSRSSVGPTHDQHQHKNVSSRRRMIGGPGYPGPPQPHHVTYVRQQQFHAQQQQQQQPQPVMIVRGHHGQGHAVAGLGRRDARHDPYLAPQGSNMNNHGSHQVNRHHPHPAHHNSMSAVSSARHGQQFFVNGNPAAVNCPPPQQQQQQVRMATAGAPPAFRGGNGNGNRQAAKAYVPHHAAGGMRNGVAMTPASTSFASRGGWPAGMAPYHNPASASTAAAGGGGNVAVPIQMAGSPSQFSMWRSQLVFAPVMQMQ